jgi:hypothetical protein
LRTDIAAHFACAWTAGFDAGQEAGRPFVYVGSGVRLEETAMEEFPLSKVYQLIEPGPVVLLTTRGESGRTS